MGVSSFTGIMPPSSKRARKKKKQQCCSSDEEHAPNPILRIPTYETSEDEAPMPTEQNNTFRHSPQDRRSASHSARSGSLHRLHRQETYSLPHRQQEPNTHSLPHRRHDITQRDTVRTPQRRYNRRPVRESGTLPHCLPIMLSTVSQAITKQWRPPQRESKMAA